MNRSTEKDKRARQEWYDAAYNSELLADYHSCQNMLYDLNMLRPDKQGKRIELLRHILGSLGCHCTVNSPFRCDYGYNVFIGDNVYINYELVILDEAKVTIGNNVFIGPQCGIYTAVHPLDFATRNTGLEKALPVAIHDNVWLGGKVCVLPGVTIGEGAVVGAGSVVTKDVPPHTLVAGNPAKVIRKISNGQQE